MQLWNWISQDFCGWRYYVSDSLKMLIIYDKRLKHFLIICFKRQIKMPFLKKFGAYVGIYKYHRIFHVIIKQWKRTGNVQTMLNYPLFRMPWGRLRHAIPTRREVNQDAPSTLNSIHFKREKHSDKLLLKYSKQWSRLNSISRGSLTWLLVVMIFSCYVPKFWGQKGSTSPV